MKRLLILFFLTSCSLSVSAKTQYLFDGAEVIYRVENSKVYRGRYSMETMYYIEGNLIYKGAEVVYRLENNLVYKGRYGTEVLYRIENNKVYRDRYSMNVLYTME
jgi:hypothetical protein